MKREAGDKSQQNEGHNQICRQGMEQRKGLIPWHRLVKKLRHLQCIKDELFSYLLRSQLVCEKSSSNVNSQAAGKYQAMQFGAVTYILEPN